MNSAHQTKLRAACIYCAAATVCLALLFWLLQLWRAQLRIPFAYANSDELTVAMSAKWLIENPWILHNPRLGMPFGSSMLNWPLPDTFYYLLFKLIALFTTQFGTVMNLFFLATFPATLLCTLWVLRQFRIGYPAALFSSFLFTFLPLHFLRGEVHLFLAAYQMVPFAGWLALRLCAGELTLRSTGLNSPRSRVDKRQLAVLLLICAVLGCSGTYYAFFGCFLLVIAGMLGSARQRSFAPAVMMAVLVATIVIAGVISVAPHLLYGRGDLAARDPADAETYGLKITQMLLPVSGHRIPALAALKNRYYQAAPLVNENDAAALGAIGAIGFVVLVAWAFYTSIGGRVRGLGRADQLRLGSAGVLSIAATLLGTIGGLGSIVATLVYPQIRSYNRISVFVAFFALFGVALILDRMIGVRARSGKAFAFYCSGLVVIAAFGILDQTPRVIVPNYRSVGAVFRSDEQFVQGIEATTPRGAMIFQLPYLTYPYASRYDHAKGYLHSHTLRWSYGAMQEGRSDLWQRAVVNRLPPQMVAEMAAAGFAGVYLDREGYPDRGAKLERELAAATGSTAGISPDNRLSFFRLPPELASGAGGISASDANELRFGDVAVKFGNGFYDEERQGQRVWHWSRAKSELTIESPEQREVTLRMLIVTGQAASSVVRISGTSLTDQTSATADGMMVERKVTLPKGSSTLHFESDAPRVDAPSDPRTMIFRIENLSIAVN